MGVVNPPSAVLFGNNNVSNGLQNGILEANGTLLSYNGPKNYIQNASFENQLTTGYSLGITGTLTNGIPTGTPTFGSGASGNLSIAIVTTNQIAGSASLSYASSAATTVGNMLASSALTIDRADQAQPLNFSISYVAQSNGLNANWSGISSNSFGVAIYDVTNSVWVIPTGVFNFIQSTGVGKCSGSFQTASNTASLRLVIYNANATSGAITMYFDDIFIGPQVISSNSSVISWNGSQSSQSVAANVTDIAFTTIKDSSAAWNGTQYVVQIAGDYLVSGSLLPNSSSSPQVYRNGSIYSGSFFSTGDSTHASAGATLVTGCKPGDTISLRMLNSTTVTSGLLGIFLISSQPGAGTGGVVAARAHVSSGVSTTAGNPFNFDTIEFDTTGSITTGATTWQFKCPISGYYQVEIDIQSTAGGTNLAVYKNSAIYGGFISATTTAPGGGATIVQCNAGDTLDIRSPNATTTPGSLTGLSVPQCNHVSIFLIQGTPAASSGLQSINARYHGSSTTISGSLATVVWSTKDFDTTASMNAGTGVYTVPTTGKYQVNCAIITGGTFSLNNSIDLQIQKNGTAWTEQTMFAFASATDISVTVGDIIQCNAGDTIQVQLSSSAVAPSIAVSNTKNWFSIALVGA